MDKQKLYNFQELMNFVWKQLFYSFVFIFVLLLGKRLISL